MGNFFRDTQGRLHGARIAGLIYAFGLVITFPALLRGTPELAVWACRGCFTLGWALAFCDSRFRDRCCNPSESGMGRFCFLS